MSELKRCTVGLGTFIEFTFPDSAQGLSAYQGAVCLLKELESQLSVFQPTSDVARWNRLSVGSYEKFGSHFLQLLNLCERLNQLSDGLFDPRIDAGVNPDPLRKGFRFKENFAVEKLQPMMVDFGGIAKGYIVDRLVEYFISQGVESGLINAGGDLRCWGDKARPVHIRLGQKAVSLIPVQLQDSAMASSGWEPYCSVKAESAVMADAFTKIFITSPEVAEHVKVEMGVSAELVHYV